MDDQTAREILDAEADRLSAARNALLRERTELQAERSMDPITDAGLLEQEIDDSLLHELDAEIAEVEEARRRVEQGAYGTCETCHRPIDDDRLAAVPATRHCVTHQEAAEASVVERGEGSAAGPEGSLGVAGAVAGRNLDLVPDDDDGSADGGRSERRGGPEEGALHVIRP